MLFIKLHIPWVELEGGVCLLDARPAKKKAFFATTN